MSRLYRFMLPVLLLASISNVSAQVDSIAHQTDTAAARNKIAVFAPLYLDSAFDGTGSYKYGKTLPKFITPGLEFYQGVQMAIDSLNKEGVELDVAIFDTRSGRQPLAKIIASDDFKGTDIIIAHVNMADAQWLAHTAKSISVPFINVNFPNEAGVTDNPQYIILNSTLYTHCEALYKFMQKNYALSPITVFRKKGAQEDRLNNYLKTIEASTASVPLKLKYVTLSDNFTQEELATHLDPDKTNIAFAASLDVSFATKLAQQLATLNNSGRASILVGMPNWDAINFTGTPFRGLDIVYSTPFYIEPADSLAAAVNKTYQATYSFRPGEMIFRGYESVYHFAHLLTQDTRPVLEKITTIRHRIFYEFNIQPVLNKKTGKADYYENKKLYFI
ncbi:MAG: hypothetical protein EOO04_32765, partial [Chitinophagaceae bacterium]